MRIRKYEWATKIKISDLQHNISTWNNPGSLKDKWKLALHILTTDVVSRVLDEEVQKEIRGR